MQPLESQPSVEKTWKERFDEVPFSNIASNEWYATDSESVRAQRANAKAKFMADPEIRAPGLDYDKLRDAHTFDETERIYQALLDETNDDNEYERAARRLAELYRHKEVIRGLGRTGAKQVLSQERAGAMSAELFGEPDKNMYLALIAKLRTQAELVTADTPEANELISLLGTDVPEVVVRTPELTRETLHRLHDDLRELFPNLDETVEIIGDPDEPLQLDEARHYMEHLLDVFGLSARGWRFETISDSEVAAKTNTQRKVVSIGEKRLASISRLQVKKTGVHEVLGHAYRAEGDVSMASLQFEEGFAVVLEQIVTETPREGSGEQYYTSLGLQLGLDQGNVRRDYRETFEVMWRRNLVLARAAGKNMTPDAARNAAYTQVYRTRRGNAIDTRDMAYFEGARLAPEWVNSIVVLPDNERQAALGWVLSGRFDPTNAVHVAQYPQS